MRRQLAAVTLGATVLILASFLIPLGLLVRTQAEDRALSRAESDARAVSTALAVAASLSSTPMDPAGAEAVLGAFGFPSGVAVFFPDGEVVGEGDRNDPDVATARLGVAFNARTPSGAAVLTPVLTGSGVLVVRADVPASELRSGVARAWTVLAAIGVLLVLVALAAADRLGRTIVSPVAALRHATDRLGAGDLSARVEPGGPPEVVAVGHAFNELAQRLGSLLQAEREAAADISHGLRTPMTALRLEVEAVTNPIVRATLLKDIFALEAAIDEVIRAARQRGGDSAGRCDLVEVARERSAFWAALAADQGRPFHTELPAEPIAVASPAREVATVMDILLENVFSHTGPSAAVRVSLKGAELVVEDGGPGFTDGALERGASGGSSTGLGLDIARRITERSGGAIAVGRSNLGGARVTADFGSVSPTPTP